MGTGIQWAAHTTLAAQAAIRDAERVVFAVADAWSARWIRELNPNSASMKYPRDGRPRSAIYEDMAQQVVAELGRYSRVCAAFYGSPSLLARPAHEAIRRARASGYRASMLPGVSSLDCLFADLGVDPGEGGCAILEAGEFVRGRRQADRKAHLILFQIAMVMNRGVYSHGDPSIAPGLLLLQRRLLEFYSASQPVVLYEASSHPLQSSRCESIRLADLHEAQLTELTTLYVAPNDTTSLSRFDIGGFVPIDVPQIPEEGRL
ncbi:MAG: SAM-dependent methyltransferase [Pseudomonadota bacterium]